MSIVSKKNTASAKPTTAEIKKTTPKATYNLFTGIGRLGRDPELRVRRVA